MPTPHLPMTNFLKQLRGALGMGLTWALGWAAAGIAVGAASLLLPFLPWWDTFFRVFDAPLPALAIPGFAGGIIFGGVLAVGARHSTLAELAFPHVLMWGALAGVMLSLVPAAMVAAGLASLGSSVADLWQLTGTIMGPLTLFSTISAMVTFVLARKISGTTVV
ncbi:MAG TPA: hypothetical protein VKZ41_13570 [Gemmatimonadales bacterium]|nr:hypothetical protein [Gemmatimonadales bacterium]